LALTNAVVLPAECFVFNPVSAFRQEFFLKIAPSGNFQPQTRKVRSSKGLFKVRDYKVKV
jgi:hypothetical protein